MDERDIKPKNSIVGGIWKMSFSAFKNQPIILLPFLISGILKLLSLFIVFFSIFYPLSIVFAPIIRTIYGEVYLHYPFNFYMMPKLFYYFQMVVYILIDGLLSGIAVYMVMQVKNRKQPNFIEAARKVLPKYFIFVSFLIFTFLLVTLVSLGSNFITTKLLGFKIIRMFLKGGVLMLGGTFFNVIIIALIETFFAFMIPLAVFKNKSFLKSIIGSVRLSSKWFWTIFLLTFVPSFIAFPFALLKLGLPAVMDKLMPEAALVILGAGVVFMMFVDAIVTVSVAFLFLSRKELQVEKPE